MNAFSIDWSLLDSLVERLGWVLVHSIWQLALIGLVATALMWGFRRASSTVRYGELLGLFGLTIAAPVVTWLMLSPAAMTTTHPIQANSEIVQPQIANAGSDTAPIIGAGTNVAGVETINADMPLRERISRLVKPYLTSIVAVWCFGLVIYSLRPMIGWRMLRRLRSVGISEPPPEIVALFANISKRLCLKQSVRLLQSTVAKTPMVVGYLRPVVLLPVSLVSSMPVSQLEAILAHELFHVRRHDFVINLLQTLVETLFFYHPVVWWLSRRIRIEREHCCDDFVVKLLNKREEYGRALIAIEHLKNQTPSLALSATDGSLLARIRRIAGSTAQIDQRLAWQLPLALLSLVCLCLSLGVAFAPHAEAQEKVDTQPTTFIAELSDGIEVELVAVGYYRSSGRPWWKPNGDPLAEPPGLPEGINFSIGSDADTKSRSREFLIEIRGLPQDQSVRTTYEAAAASGSVFSGGLWVGYHGAGPFDTPTTNIRVSIATTPYGPWMSIDADGQKSSQIELPKRLQSLYDRIVATAVESHGESTTLLVENEPFTSLFDLADFELYAVDTAGKQHRPSSESGRSNDWPRSLTFKLPHADIVRFEYRLRPYTKWVTFDDVSLKPGVRSRVSITTKATVE